MLYNIYTTVTIYANKTFFFISPVLNSFDYIATVVQINPSYPTVLLIFHYPSFKALKNPFS